MKQLTSDNYLIRPFVTHKTQDYNYTFLGGGNSDKISIDIASKPPTVTPWIWHADNEPVNADGIYQRTLYASVHNMLYNSVITSSTGSRTDLQFRPTGSQFYVINIAQQAFGERIRAGSVRLTSMSSTGSLIDDGFGRIVPADAPSAVVGSVFYSSGIIVLQQASAPFTASVISANGAHFTTGSHIDVEFDATHTIYEHQVVCTMDPHDFNYSINPSIRREGTRTVMDRFVSGTMAPYMTSVGLFNDQGEMVAVAKFSRAIKRAIETQQSIIVRYDI